MNFKNLHQQTHPLLISNVWDVPSAKVAQKLGFQAIGTSSAAIATMLGYEDGEEMDFGELAYIVQRICKSVDLPLSVDIEAGFSREPQQIHEHILSLAEMGVVGINFEDSVVEETRVLLDVDLFQDSLYKLCSLLKAQNPEVFLNVRTDPFLLGVPDALAETLTRVKKYEEAGADGIFVPCITQASDIEKVVKATSLPLNVMCMPDLPSFDQLQKLGVKRISMGNFLFNNLTQELENRLDQILSHQSFTPLFAS